MANPNDNGGNNAYLATENQSTEITERINGRYNHRWSRLRLHSQEIVDDMILMAENSVEAAKKLVALAEYKLKKATRIAERIKSMAGGIIYHARFARDRNAARALDMPGYEAYLEDDEAIMGVQDEVERYLTVAATRRNAVRNLNTRIRNVLRPGEIAFQQMLNARPEVPADDPNAFFRHGGFDDESLQEYYRLIDQLEGFLTDVNKCLLKIQNLVPRYDRSIQNLENMLNDVRALVNRFNVPGFNDDRCGRYNGGGRGNDLPTSILEEITLPLDNFVGSTSLSSDLTLSLEGSKADAESSNANSEAKMMFIANNTSTLGVSPWTTKTEPSATWPLQVYPRTRSVITFGAQPSHLITASVMCAPAVLCFSKLFYSESEKSQKAFKNIPLLKSYVIYLYV